jgi:uncharacterized protein (DUF736 family)
MSYEMNDDTFTLFKNDEKQNEKQPDYKGKIKINGKERPIAVWIKEAKNGRKYMSGKVSDYKMPEEVKRAAAPEPEFNDDLPW